LFRKTAIKGYEKELEEKLNKLGTGRKIKEKEGFDIWRGQLEHKVEEHIEVR
jgi:hypothetical protein